MATIPLLKHNALIRSIARELQRVLAACCVSSFDKTVPEPIFGPPALFHFPSVSPSLPLSPPVLVLVSPAVFPPNMTELLFLPNKNLVTPLVLFLFILVVGDTHVVLMLCFCSWYLFLVPFFYLSSSDIPLAIGPCNKVVPHCTPHGGPPPFLLVATPIPVPQLVYKLQ